MKHRMRFVLFRDLAKEYRWKLVASNGRSIAVSGEGYQRRAGAIKAILIVREQAPHAEFDFTRQVGK